MGKKMVSFISWAPHSISKYIYNYDENRRAQLMVSERSKTAFIDYKPLVLIILTVVK